MQKNLDENAHRVLNPPILCSIIKSLMLLVKHIVKELAAGACVLVASVAVMFINTGYQLFLIVH
jgi:uncharacterized membrane protein YqhA